MLWNRMVRAARLDAQVYEEVEADESAMGQATVVVVLSSLAAGIGSYQMAGFVGLIGGTAAALISWYAWSFVTYMIGAKLLPEAQTEATYGQLLRTIGFASAPGLLRILGVIPSLYLIASFVAGVWMLVAMVIAVRQALDYEGTARAIGVCVIGWLAQSIVFVVLAMLIGGGVAATGDY